MKKILVGLLFMSLFLASSVFGTVSDDGLGCNLADAMDNGGYADFCYYTDDNPGNPTAEALFINTEGGLSEPIADPYVYVDKYEDGSSSTDGMTGWTLTVTDLDDAAFGFKYTLEAPESYSGTVVDFALGVKQAESYIAYIFKAVTLDISGFFNSTWSGGQDYSHVSAFIVGAAPVPEPSTLLLLGAGIAGLAVYRRKKH